MQADIEIQSAAKLPTRHVRRSSGTGARSSLLSALDSSEGARAGMTMGCLMQPAMLPATRLWSRAILCAAKSGPRGAALRNAVAPVGLNELEVVAPDAAVGVDIVAEV